MRPKIPPELAERFRRACPIWAKRIMNNKFNPVILDQEFIDADGQRWHIASACGCIVGEAHSRRTGYPPYKCGLCANFSYHIMQVFDSGWINTLRQFLDHYEKKHAKKAHT